MKLNFSLFFFLICLMASSQRQAIQITASLDVHKHELNIQQNIVFKNTSKDTLTAIYLHNWMNSYRDNKTPLSQRLLEDYDRSLYFSKEKNRGHSKIIRISNKFENTNLEIEQNVSDLVKVILNKPLAPSTSITMKAIYIVKIPIDKYTKYGRNKNSYNLRYWYLTPVIYQSSKWITESNLNTDDLFMYPTDYVINFNIPKDLNLESDLNLQKKTIDGNRKTYTLMGEKRLDIAISITPKKTFTHYQTDNLLISTNMNSHNIKTENATSVLNRQIHFIESYLGMYPHKKLTLNKTIYEKNPVYGVTQLPKILNPFLDIFEFDIEFFKVLTNKYINNTIITNRRNDGWINDGIQTFLMIKYIDEFYPDIKAMGKISKLWGIRTYQLAKLDYNKKYGFVHQFAMRKNLDQALTKRSDSLSTFNRKIVNKYKAGLGLRYLDEFLDGDILRKSLSEFYDTNVNRITSSSSFETIIKSNTNKDLSWFFGNYLQSNKKIDYTIKRITKTSDSLLITIKNKRSITMPILLYGLKDEKVIYKQWFTNIDSVKTIKIAKSNYDRFSLNYENIYPETILNNNWKNVKPSLFNRPFQFRFMKDIDNPFYNQIFYNIEYNYNFYDGILASFSLSNKTFVKKKWRYKLKPEYGFKSKKVSGSFSFTYTNYPENSELYKIRSGIGANTSHYNENLSYTKISPYISLDFKRKNLRDVGGKYILARYILIDRETANNAVPLESDSYQVLNTRFGYYKPDIVKNIGYSADIQIAQKFSKLAIKFHYKYLSKKMRRANFRLYAGTFLHNNTNSDFFDFSLNRPSDYLFDYNYFGRSEESGFLSQQYIVAEGGFKSTFSKNTANQWLISTNTSFSLWRWIELYGDAGIYKNQGFNTQFKYDSGIRLNFVPNFFEIYFPIQSSNGFEINQPYYPEKIRFVLSLSFGRMLSFAKRGFY